MEKEHHIVQVGGQESVDLVQVSEQGGVDDDCINTALLRYEPRQSMEESMETVTLSWENVNVYVNPEKRACCRGPDPNKPPKQILRNMYGNVKPGTLLAIIGASGSGKTTLLNTLISRLNSEVFTSVGEINVNGNDVGTGIQNISAYVREETLFIATMTVKEHLTFRAMLRMEKEVSRTKRLERVDEVIKELGLTKCQDNMIGDPGRIKGISSGEMRRLSFATEILTNPPLLFCDEPTSGLDSFMAENIVQTLASMADKGKTVLCTIHQPSSEVFALFHNVLVIAEGRVAYFGDTGGALQFYKDVGFACPVNYNPADFYIMTMAVVPGKETDCKQRIEEVCDNFAESTAAEAVYAENKRVAEKPKRTGIIYKESLSSTSRYEATWYRQFGVLTARAWRTTVREPLLVKARIIQSTTYVKFCGHLGIRVVKVLRSSPYALAFLPAVPNTTMLALALGLVFLQLDVDQDGVMNINGALFMSLLTMTLPVVIGVLNTFPLELPIFLREYGTGLYRVDIYFLSKALAELPTLVVLPLIFSCIIYWMVGFFASFETFLVFTGVVILVSNISASFGCIVSAAASSVNMALTIGPPLIIPMILFGGFFVNAESVPVYLIWLEYLSWFKYANELLIVNQWTKIDSIGCDEIRNSSSPGTDSDPCLFKDGKQVMNYLNFDQDNLVMDVGLLLVLLFGYRFIAFLVLFVKARRYRL